MHMYFGSYLYVLSELIVAVDVHGRELAHLVKLEVYLNHIVLSRVVPPSYPPLRVVIEGSLEVFRTDSAIGQKTQSVTQTSAVPVAVVGCVVEFPVGAALVSLRHRVAHDTWN